MTIPAMAPSESPEGEGMVVGGATGETTSELSVDWMLVGVYPATATSEGSDWESADAALMFEGPLDEGGNAIVAVNPGALFAVVVSVMVM